MNKLQVLGLLWLALGQTAVAAPPQPVETAPVTATVTVDWSRTLARATPWTFGSNDFWITQPGENGAGLAPSLKQTGITLLRLHNGSISDAWSDSQTQTWDEAKIREAYDAPGLRGPTLLQNIPGWPSWMKRDKDGLLDPSEYDRYAAFCAGLVRIVNGDLKRRVVWWEPLNEQDVAYAKAGRLDDLWTIYKKCGAAMRAVDPSIKVGGAAFTWDDPAKIESFLKACAPETDFLSWHRYGSGSAQDTTDKIMAMTPDFEREARALRALADRYSPSRRILLATDEFSVDYTYESGETRQWSNVGAVWFASVLGHLARAGVDMGMSWNLQDGFYGLIAPNGAPRPAATVYAWANAFLVGAVAAADSDQPALESLAVRRADHSRALLLINKSGEPATITLRGAGAVGGGPVIAAQRLDSAGVTQLGPTSVSLPVTLGPYSLVLLRFGRR